MKRFVTVLSLVLASSTVFAKARKPDAICTNDGGVEVSIEKLGFDAKGALFQGIITKNGRLIRNSKMRRVLISNGFALYAVGRDGTTAWSFNVSSLRSAYISDQTDYNDIARVLGKGNTTITCDRNLPLVYWSE